MKRFFITLTLVTLATTSLQAQTAPFYRGEQVKVGVGFTTVAQVILAAESFGRPIFSGPGTPPERLNLLRRAFDQAMKDPELLDETKKQKMEVDSESGEELEKLAKQVMQQPAEVIARVKKILGN